MQTYEISLDMKKAPGRIERTVVVRRGDADTQTIEAAITAGGEPYAPRGAARLDIMHADGTWARCAATLSGPTVSCTMPNAALNGPGRCRAAHFVFTDGAKVESTEGFALVIEDNVDVNGTPGAQGYDSELEALKDAWRKFTERAEQAESARAEAEAARKAAETARGEAEGRRAEAETGREQAETARADAETKRAAAEGERAEAEKARADAETARMAEESKRAEAEAERKRAETVRADAEGRRTTAETARATAEDARKAAETARAEAETARASKESERASAESARAEAEQTRASEESKRAAAETERNEAERARADAETARKAAETKRAQAETARETAEAKRGEAENARADAESRRAEAEAGRESAEEERKAKEAERASAEADRKAAETGRKRAEDAREAAETARAQAEQSRASEESKRAAAETERNEAEDGRKSAEAARAKAEQGRVTAEQSRVQAETARASAENARVQAETARAGAETGRADAETKRTAAEAARVEAEQARATAEQGRTTAEAARAGAETKRGEAEAARADAESRRAAAETARAQAETAREAAQAKNNADQALNNEQMKKLSPVILQAGQYDPSTLTPTVTGEPNRVYFVPMVAPAAIELYGATEAEVQAGNSYMEWMWVGGKWELMGQSEIKIKPITTDQVDAVFAGTHPTGDSVLNLTGLDYVRTKDAELLDGKADASHTHTAGDIASGTLDPARVPVLPTAKVDGLQAALDGKQPRGEYAAKAHTHAVADVDGLQGALDGKAAASHRHAAADIDGLDAAAGGVKVVRTDKDYPDGHDKDGFYVTLKDATDPLYPAYYASQAIVLFRSGLAMWKNGRISVSGAIYFSGPVIGCTARFACSGSGSPGNGGRLDVHDGGLLSQYRSCCEATIDTATIDEWVYENVPLSGYGSRPLEVFMDQNEGSQDWYAMTLRLPYGDFDSGTGKTVLRTSQAESGICGGAYGSFGELTRQWDAASGLIVRFVREC